MIEIMGYPDVSGGFYKKHCQFSAGVDWASTYSNGHYWHVVSRHLVICYITALVR